MENEILESEILDDRNYLVVKSNKLIQRTRYQLSLQEQKAIAYICSKIKPDEDENNFQLKYTFDIRNYCKVCGIHYDSGKNYKEIKATLQKLSDRSMWIEKGDEEVLVRWLSKVQIDKRNGLVHIRLDEDLIPYLFGLNQQFTQYQLLDVLGMKSAYSIRLYELLKSYAGMKQKTFELDDLRKRLMVENIASYKRFPDFKCKVLNTAIKEINALTAIKVDYLTICKGRKVVKVQFNITVKDTSSYIESQANAENAITN